MVSSALTPRVDALSATVKEISSTAVAATAAANEGGLQVMAGLLDRLVSQMVQGQLQVCGEDQGHLHSISTHAGVSFGIGFHGSQG